MKNELEERYKIKIEAIIKNSPKTYKIITDKEEYILKEHENQSLENVFSRISILNLHCFVIPKKSEDGKFIEMIDGKYYSLSEYFKDEDILAKDLRINFFIKCIANLHQITTYPLKVNDGYFHDSVAYLDNKISSVKDEIFSRIQRVEHEFYHSPSDWYFLMNYPLIFNALKEADRYVTMLEEEWENTKNVHLSFVYQNFDYSHILVKQGKITSLDKMALAPSIYDLIDIFKNAYEDKMDISFLLKEYLDIHPLEKYEEYWLMAFLFIPQIERNEKDIIDINNTFHCLEKIKLAESIGSSFSLEAPE